MREPASKKNIRLAGGAMISRPKGATAALLATVALAVPLALGCAGRTAPFNEMDQAQVTVLRLQGQEPPPTAAPATGQAPLIPGIPPELQQMGQQALQGLQQVLPPGVIPPGLLPGAPGAAPQQAAAPRWKGYIILAQMPLSDEKVKDEILDVFGAEDSFQEGKGQCFFPGMGVSLNRARPRSICSSRSRAIRRRVTASSGPTRSMV